jgi:hypothetical protein
MTARGTLLVVVGAAALVIACGAAGVRPRFEPFPLAVVDTLPLEAAVLIGALTDAVRAESLAVQRMSTAEGYLETRWFDVVRRRTARALTGHPYRLVKLRFFADPVGGGRSQLVSEVATRIAVDPSLPERQAEMMAPPDHPGRALLDSVLVAVRNIRLEGS